MIKADDPRHPEAGKTHADACRVADQIVPLYRSENRTYSCTGQMAKRWSAAYEAALTVLRERGGTT